MSHTAYCKWNSYRFLKDKTKTEAYMCDRILALATEACPLNSLTVTNM